MHETLIESIVPATRWSTGVLVGLVVLGLIVVLMTWRNVRHVRRPGRRALLIGLRAVTVALFLVLLLEPVRKEQRIRRVRNHVAVAVDVSQSMATPTRGGTRMDAARRYLEKLDAQQEVLARDHNVRRFTFGGELRPLADDAPAEALMPREPASRVLEALSDLAVALEGKDVAAVVLVSDGVDNGALDHLQRGQATPVREVREVLDRLGAPVHLVQAGDPEGFVDIRVVELRAPGFTFVMNAASLDAVIEIVGEPPPLLEITLYEDGRPSRTERLPTVPDKRLYTVTLPFLPRRVGEHVYTVRVGPAPGEDYLANNQRSVLIPAVRDRIRVLQVAGHPSFDQRFLRDFLKSNPSVDLVSFFILVDPNDQRTMADETALIPFPVRELFEDELPGFDLVVFQDFEHRRQGVAQYLPHLKSYVHNGGALLIIGGPRSFERGGYQGTLLEDVLPVRLRSGSGRDMVDTAPFRARVTAAGRHHPVLRLLPDEAENATLFDELPLLEGVNRVAGLRDDAVGLLVHPTQLGTDGQPLPVVALREVEMGRTLTVTTDSLWRWNFAYAGDGGDAYPYNRFWSASLAWLMRDPEMIPVRVVIEPTSPQEGEPARVHVSIADPSFRPAADHPFTLEVFREQDPTAPGSEQRLEVVDDRRSGADGRAEVVIEPPGSGVYRVVVKATFDDRVLTGERRMVVDPGTEERSRVSDPDNLVQLLVEHSGGRVLPATERIEGLELRTAETLLVSRERERPLWNHAGVLLLAILLLGAEWALRKRSGLP